MDSELERCPVSWCDQGTRPHTRHEVTLGTWPGIPYSGDRRLISAQLVVHGFGDDDAQPMLALVDSASLEQVDCMLDWADAKALGRQLIEAVERRH